MSATDALFSRRDRSPRSTGQRSGPYAVGLLVVIATVTMLFAGFTAALLVRRTAPDWVSLRLPDVVWVNTLLLAASSVAVEFARSRSRSGDPASTSAGLLGSFLLGVLFLAGQVFAWRALTSENVVLSSGPHAAFFYVLSGVHGLHILAGLVALGWTARRAGRGAYGPRSQTGLDHTAIYWHFIGVVWLYLLLVLTLL